MRILITGGAGFIGSHLGDALEGEHEVWAFDNYLTGRAGNRQGVIEMDIRDRERLYVMANEVQPHVILHCAASYADPDKWHLDTDINVNGAINIVNVARHHSAHLIYFQTILPPVSSYAISKIAAEQYLRLSGVPLTVFRLANVYGPRNLSGPVPVFYKRLTNGQPCTVVDTTRDMVYVIDVVKAVVYAAETTEVGTFDLCTGKQTPIVDIFNEVAHTLEMDSAVATVVPPADDDVQGDISVYRRPPGWIPQMSLEYGIESAVQWYAENGVFDTHTHLRLKG